MNLFDLALAPNRVSPQRLRDGGVRLRYFNHHASGDLPRGALFEAVINDPTIAD